MDIARRTTSRNRRETSLRNRAVTLAHRRIRLSRRFAALSQAAGLPRIVFHGLRHTHATHALAAGVPITVVANRLGHARSSFTADTYTRVLPEADREAAQLVADMVGQAGRNPPSSEAP
jgi:integrase